MHPYIKKRIPMINELCNKYEMDSCQVLNLSYRILREALNSEITLPLFLYREEDNFKTYIDYHLHRR